MQAKMVRSFRVTGSLQERGRPNVAFVIERNDDCPRLELFSDAQIFWSGCKETGKARQLTAKEANGFRERQPERGSGGPLWFDGLHPPCPIAALSSPDLWIGASSERLMGLDFRMGWNQNPRIGDGEVPIDG